MISGFLIWVPYDLHMKTLEKLAQSHSNLMNVPHISPNLSCTVFRVTPSVFISKSVASSTVWRQMDRPTTDMPISVSTSSVIVIYPNGM